MRRWSTQNCNLLEEMMQDVLSGNVNDNHRGSSNEGRRRVPFGLPRTHIGLIIIAYGELKGHLRTTNPTDPVPLFPSRTYFHRVTSASARKLLSPMWLRSN